MKISILPQFILEFFRISWLSVSSTKFYQDLYRHYKGFGIRYISVVISITTIIFMILDYTTIINIRKQITSDGDNQMTQIISQIPTMEYNKGQISLDGDPVLILNNRGKTVIAIDPDKKLSPPERKGIPLILEKSYFSTNFRYSRLLSDTSLNYSDIFGNESKTIDNGFIREILIDGLDAITPLLVALITPVIIAISIALHIYQHLFLILITFIFLLLIGLRPSLKSAFRLIMFATAMPLLISPVLFILTNNILLVNKISIFVRFWTLFLAGFSLIRR